MKSGTWKRLICFALTFDLAGAPLLVHAADNGYSARRGKPAQRVDNTSQQIAAAFAHASSDEALERAKGPMIDTWSLKNQTVKVYEAKEKGQKPSYEYGVERGGLNRVAPVSTKLKPFINPECNDCVSFEATRGMNDNDKNGTYVADLNLNDVANVAALAVDEELIHVVDKFGHIHVIDNGFVALEGFTSVIPTEHNIWEPLEPMNLEGRNVVARYWTPAAKVPDLSKQMPNAVIPMVNGQVVLEAGDLIVEVDGYLMGIFSRDISHTRLEIAESVILAQAAWANKDRHAIKTLGKLLEFHEKKDNDFDEALDKAESLPLDPTVAIAFASMGKKQYGALMSRIEDNAKSVSAKRPRDKTTLANALEMQSFFEEAKEKYRNLEDNKGKSEEAIERAWHDQLTPAYEPEHTTTVGQDFLIQKFGYTPDVAKKKAAKIAHARNVAAGLAVLVGLLHAPMLYEQSEMLQQINVVSWIYQHYPPVLKDAVQRDPTIKSILVLTALWPVSLMASWASGWSFKALNKILPESRSKFAQKVRDIAITWGPMDEWTRITTNGLRNYAKLVLAPYIHLVETVGRQKALIPAMTANINPFRTIKKDSPEGEAVGLSKDTSIGFRNPLAKDARQRGDEQSALLSELMRQRNNRRTYLRLLAGMAVAEHYGIDQATMRMLGPIPDLKLSDVKDLVTDKKKQLEWDLTTEALQRQIVALPLAVTTGELELSEDDTVLMASDFAEAQKAVKKILALKGADLIVRQLRVNSVRFGLWTKDQLLNMGRTQYNFLKKIILAPMYSANVAREFVVDHLYVVILIALFGDRARLDQPENLSASADGLLWVSPQHWADVGYNVYAHFFMSAARQAMGYMKLTSKKAEYVLPRESYVNSMREDGTSKLPIKDNAFSKWVKTTVGHAARTVLGLKQPEPAAGQLKPHLERESLLRGVGNLALDAALPWRSDVGSQMRIIVEREVATISAYFITQIALRTTIGHQSIADAPAGTLITWLLAWILIRPWWLVVNQTTGVAHDRYEEKVNHFREAQRKLEWSLRETDPAERHKLQHEGTWEMFTLYDENTPHLIQPEFNPLTSKKPITELAVAFLQLSKEKSPGAMAPNGMIPWLSTTIAAIGSTIVFVPAVIQSYDPANMTFTALSIYALEAALFAGAVILLGRKKPAEAFRQKVVNKFEQLRDRVIYGKCETDLVKN